MRKSTRIVKSFFALLLVVLMSIESFGAVVSDNDGSAFITKAEFDSLKNNFQSQIDQYNTSIDSKIDGAIASYLAGINVDKISTERLMLWGGKTLGLLENVKSRPYKEGTVNGKFEYTGWFPKLRSGGSNHWYSGNPTEVNTAGNNVPAYLSFCHHIFTAGGVPFKYCVVRPNSNNNRFDLLGYANVVESMSGSAFSSENVDFTMAGRFLFGFCTGWNPVRFNLNVDIATYSGRLVSLCETQNTYNAGRGASGGYTHNTMEMKFSDATFSSEYTLDEANRYLSNATAATPYSGLRDIKWHGINLTNDATETHTYGELAKQGWEINTTKNQNFHIKQSISHSSIDTESNSYGCYSMTWVRGISGDGSGATYSHQSSYPHGQVPSTNNFKKLFKADLGDEVTASNIYSSEIGNVISDDMPDKVTTDVFDGVSKTIAPLSIGLPIATVKENDSVKLELDFLNAADYTVAFAVGGFDTEPIANTIGTDTGCVVKGSTNHMISFTGPRTAEPITVNVNKDGILFLKYSATGDNAQQIKLPVTCVITTNG